MPTAPHAAHEFSEQRLGIAPPLTFLRASANLPLVLLGSRAVVMRGLSATCKPPRKAEPVALFGVLSAEIYAAAISRVALIGSFSTLQSALKFASRGLT